MSIFTKQFVVDAAERAIKTFAQGALATLGVGTTDLLSTDWGGVLSVGAAAAIVSVLTSILSTNRDNTVSPASAAKEPEPTVTELDRHNGDLK